MKRYPAAAGPRTMPALILSACAVAGLLFTGVAAAADGKLSEAQARYRQDRAACMSVRSNEDRATCLREAGAALQAAKRGQLGDDQGSYEKNRLLRCDRLKGDDREDCIRRMRGEGTVKGSVESGGRYWELRTTVPAQ
jgi:hypothetical protein